MIRFLKLIFVLCVITSCESKTEPVVIKEKDRTFELVYPKFFKLTYDSILMVEKNGRFQARISEKSLNCIRSSKPKFMKVNPKFYIRFYRNGVCKESILYIRPNIIKYHGSAYILECNLEFDR